MIPALVPAFPPTSLITNNTLYATLQSLGLTSGLQTCLDASDAASYTSGQTWTDETGNGYSFFRGNSSSVEASDPTFNGTPGSLSSSNYWSVNGSQWLTLNQSNPTWVNNIHKNNATFTILMWVYIVTHNCVLMGDFSSSSPLFEFSDTAGAKLEFIVDGETTTVYDHTTSASIPTNSWVFLAVSGAEATPLFVYQINSTQETNATAYSGPSSNNAGNTVKILADGDTLGPMKNGGRCASVAVWNTALTATQLNAIFTSTRGKFGI